MKHDELLAFLSEKGSGSWDDLREGWRWLTSESADPAEKAWIAAHDLSSLGHLEVAWDHGLAWCVPDPVLTMIPRSGGRALLTGGRPRALYCSTDAGPDGALPRAAEDLELWVDSWATPGGPSTVMVACEDSDDARRLAKKLGITYTYSIADLLAGMLPALGTYANLWPAGDLPRGFEAERFNETTLAWEPATSLDKHGLYRCRTWQQYVHALHAATGWKRVPRELGIYEVLRWEGRTVVAFDADRFELTVPASARLPVLQARAAILCSGRLPRFSRVDGRATLTYDNVSSQVAERVAASLLQGVPGGG